MQRKPPLLATVNCRCWAWECGQCPASRLLERDIRNINRFFKNRGADIIEDATILEETLNGKDEEDGEEEE